MDDEVDEFTVVLVGDVGVDLCECCGGITLTIADDEKKAISVSEIEPNEAREIAKALIAAAINSELGSIKNCNANQVH